MSGGREARALNIRIKEDDFPSTSKVELLLRVFSGRPPLFSVEGGGDQLTVIVAPPEGL